MIQSIVRSILTAALLFIICISGGFSQPTAHYPQTEKYRFKHLRTEDGLPSNYTWSILQDSKGFMWFTTRAGLCRYDGYNIKVFTYHPNDSSSLSNSYLKSTIAEDTNGNIWVGSLDGLNKFDPVNETFTRYYHNPYDSLSISHNAIRYIYLDKMGSLWIGTKNGGLNKYNYQSDNFISFLPSPDYSLSNMVKGIFEDSSGILWIGTHYGLYQFDRITNSFKLIAQIRQKGDPIHNRFITITEDHHGNIWYCADQIYTYNKTTGELSLFEDFNVESSGSANPKYMSIYLDSDKEGQFLWIARNHLYKWYIDSHKLINVFHDALYPESFVGRNPRYFYKDRSGLLWVSTVDGIGILDTYSNQIKANIDFYKEFDHNGATFYEDDQGNLWIGSSQFLVKNDMQLNQFVTYGAAKNSIVRNTFDGLPFKIIEDRHNNIWMACNRGGVYMLDRINKEFVKCRLIADKLEAFPSNFYDILEDSQGNIYVACDGLYKRNTDFEDPYTFYLDTTHSITKYSTIAHIEEDNEGNIWLGSLAGDGILKISPSKSETDKCHVYKHLQDNNKSLSNSYIWSVYIDDLGEIWIGTNQGLNWYNKEKDCFERHLIHSENGFSVIYDISRDKNGILWLITEGGLISYDPSGSNDPNKQNGVKQYLALDQLFKHKIFKDESGLMYVGSASGTDNGYFRFQPEEIIKNKSAPPVAITSLKIKNREAELDTSIIDIKSLVLNYNENFFSFEFAALDFSDPSQNKYKYILEGLDDDWINSGNQRIANYTSVPPGNYRFMVRASNSDGIWNEEGTSVSLIVLPPPWKTWWAYTLYILIILSVIASIVRFYLRRQRLLHKLQLEQMQTEKLEELDRFKSHFFENISHEFRTPLTLISGPISKHLDTADDESLKNDLEVMQRNTVRLQRLINQLLYLSKLESSQLKIHATQENIVSLVKYYVQSFESLSLQKNIKLSFISSEENIPLYVDKEKIEKILFNLLSNAFKFTESGSKIEVEILYGIQDGKKHVHIKVSDTGLGIPKDKLNHIFDRFYQVDDSYTKDYEGTGIGLALTKELVKLHHGDISVESETGKGSTFTISLLTGNAHFDADEIMETSEQEISLDIPEEVQSVSEKRNEPYPLKTRDEETKPLILIVEDNTDLRKYIRENFDKSYLVLEAMNGQEGLEECIKAIPDLVISDVMMPKMDGFELCKKIKLDERTSHIPVVLLTARASIESKIEGLETGADDYLSKPFNPKELKIRVKNLILQRNKLQKKFISDFWKENKSLNLIIPSSELSTPDKNFLQKALDAVERHISDPDFNIERLGREIGFSRQQMHRKFKALVDQSTTEFIRTIRLKKAAELLSKKSGTVSEIAFDVGFNTLSYFTKCFQEQFGVKPSEYTEKYFNK